MKVQIPNPCHEDFYKMTPTEKGRFCALCQTEVVDFSKMSPKEISQHLSKSGKTCGVFKPEQLNTKLNPISSEIIPHWFRKLSFGVLSFTGIAVSAQQTQNSEESQEYIFTETEMIKNPECSTDTIERAEEEFIMGDVLLPMQRSEGKDSIELTKSDTLQNITGTVIDEDGLPMADLEIYLPNGKTSTFTDFDGNFNIQSKIGDSLTLIDIHGFEQEILIDKNDLTTIIFESPQTDFESLQGVLGGAVVFRTSIPQKALRVVTYPYRKVRNWIRGY